MCVCARAAFKFLNRRLVFFCFLEMIMTIKRQTIKNEPKERKRKPHTHNVQVKKNKSNDNYDVKKRRRKRNLNRF